MTPPTMSAHSRIEIDPGNAAAYDAWNGADGDHWATNAETFDRSLARYRPAFLDATLITPSDRVLDVGCGNGKSSLDAARLARRGHVIGIDLSAPMLEIARRRAAAEEVTNVEFLHADVQIHPFEPASFNAAVSHTGAMFFGDAVAAFTNLARALHASAPLTLLVWQPPQANPWFQELTEILAAGRPVPTPAAGAPGPFSLADPDHARALLGAAGFNKVSIDGLHEPMWFGTTAEDASRFITGIGVFAAMLRELEPDARDAALTKLRDSIDAHRTVDGIQYPSAMWLITATGQ
jgi:ubiquinone/menaquinone biosynthesis C-methylase UbiE